MAGITRIRGAQTTAGSSYDVKDTNNLATDKEVEERVKKHSSIFHHNRDEKTLFEFNADGNISKIQIMDINNNLTQESNFFFNTEGSLLKIIKEIFDENQVSYSKIQKDFTFINGNISTITNTIIQ